MSTVDDFVRESILQTPDLFGSRTDVLRFVFCLPENGLTWTEDGDIETPLKPHWNAETSPALRARECFGGGIMLKIMEREFERLKDIHQKTVDEVDERMFLRHPLDFLDQRSNDALIMHIPANIQPDWYEAYKEIKELLEDGGWEF